jgi:hypothetical protein
MLPGTTAAADKAMMPVPVCHARRAACSSIWVAAQASAGAPAAGGLRMQYGAGIWVLGIQTLAIQLGSYMQRTGKSPAAPTATAADLLKHALKCCQFDRFCTVRRRAV